MQHYAIEIDGDITNPFIYSADLYYDAQDPNPASIPVNWDSTVKYDDVNINGANYAASTMFDTTNTTHNHQPITIALSGVLDKRSR